MLPRSGNTEAFHRSGQARARQSLLNAANNPALHINALCERRKTLQTISELSTQDATSMEWTDTSSKAYCNALNGPTVSSKSAKINRTRSLSYHGPEYDTPTKPSVLVTATDAPSLRRSLTDPSNWKRDASRRSSNGSRVSVGIDHNGLSASSFLHCRHSQDPPLFSITEGTQSDPRNANHTIYSHPPYFKQYGAHAKKPNRSANGQVHHSEDWNAQREREQINHEQAIAAAKAHREVEGHIVMGSPSALSYLSPLPMATAKEIHIKRQSSQKQFLSQAQQNYDSRAHDSLGRRASHGQMPVHVNVNHTNQLVPQRASTGGHSLNMTQRGVLQRSQSAAPDPSWTYHANSAIRATPELARTSLSQNRYQRNRTKSSSLSTPSPKSTCSSSRLSNASGKSNGTNQTQRSYSSYTSSGSRYHAKHQTIKGRLEVFPALPDMLSLTNPSAPVSHPAAPNAGLRRSSQSSQHSTKNSLTQNPPRPQLSTVDIKATSDTSSIIYRENPDKRGVLGVAPKPQDLELVKKREKSIQSKTEKEKLELEKTARERAREKVRERVKRANELEQEKEKELIKEEEKKRRWNFFCGLFGK